MGPCASSLPSHTPALTRDVHEAACRARGLPRRRRLGRRRRGLPQRVRHHVPQHAGCTGGAGEALDKPAEVSQFLVVLENDRGRWLLGFAIKQ